MSDHTETPVEKPEAVKVETKKVEAVKVKYHKPEAKPGTKYWLGVTDECPFRKLDVAGMDFPYKQTPPRWNKDGEQYRDHLLGKIVTLSDDHVALIKKKILKKFIRWNAARRRAWTVSVETVGYSPQPTDEPFAKYMYMIKVEDRMPNNFRIKPGETMLQE